MWFYLTTPTQWPTNSAACSRRFTWTDSFMVFKYNPINPFGETGWPETRKKETNRDPSSMENGHPEFVNPFPERADY